MPGPAPTPTRLLQLTGSSALRKPGHALRDEPEPEIGRPERPAWLSDLACEEWDFVVDVLVNTGTIARVESRVLALYATAVAEFRELDAIVQDEGLDHSRRQAWRHA